MYFCTEIANGVTWIGVNDRKTERFENIHISKSKLKFILA
mgnify:CR=1 FL=1